MATDWKQPKSSSTVILLKYDSKNEMLGNLKKGGSSLCIDIEWFPKYFAKWKKQGVDHCE